MNSISIKTDTLIIQAGAQTHPQEKQLALLLTLPEFTRGYQGGRREFAQSELAGIPLTDVEVLDAIRGFIADGALEDDAMLEYAVGSLLGWISGNR